MPYDPQLLYSIHAALTARPFEDIEDLSRTLGAMGNQVCDLVDEFSAVGNELSAKKAEGVCDTLLTIGFCLSKIKIGPFPTEADVNLQTEAEA